MSHSSNLTEQRDICIGNDVGYVTKAVEICLQLSIVSQVTMYGLLIEFASDCKNGGAY